MHLFDVGKRFLGGHGIVGGHIPLAAGVGFAIKYKGASRSVSAFSERRRSTSAPSTKPSTWPPCTSSRHLLLREQPLRHGHAFERVAAVTDVVEHACSYDMAAEFVDGMDVLAVKAATERAVQRARNGGHPTLLEVRTYRYMGHSMSDPLHGVYRTKEEVEEQKKRDPISHLGLKLKEEGALDDAGLDAMEAEVRAVAEAAVKFADESPIPIRQSSTRTSCPTEHMPTLTYRDALNQALREEMQRDPNVFLMGRRSGSTRAPTR